MRFHFVSAYSFAHGKLNNSKRLQKETYGSVRAQFALPAQMARSVPRQVGATYKGLWTKANKNAEARHLGSTKRRFKGLDQAPRDVSPTLIYVYGHDYSLKTEQRVSLLTRAGRMIISYQGWSRHLTVLRETAAIGAAKLWYDRAKKRFYLLVSLTIETPDPAPESHTSIVGGDVGQRYLATVATLANGAQFYSGKEIRAKADHYARLQKRLQRKGTWLCNTTAHRHQRARETVKVGYQPRYQQAPAGYPSQEFHGPGGFDPHPRAHQTQAWQESDQEAAPGEPARLQMGLCGTARLLGLQSRLVRLASR